MAVTDIAVIKRDTADLVAAKVNQLQQAGELMLPKNYAAVNALKSAWLMLQSTKTSDQRPVLAACTKDSIYNAMFDMVVQGLNPAKRQCYFIAYGDQLGCQRSYFGDEYLVREIRPDVEVYYNVIYAGDDFEHAIERGKSRVTKHVQKFGNIDPAKIAGAYCVIEDQDGKIVNSAVMTLAQIKTSWKKSKTYKEGGNSFHHDQPDQACLRTVIRRTCKPVISASSDSWLMAAVGREEQTTEHEIEAEAAAEANYRVIDAETGEVGELPAETTDATAAEAQAQAAPAQDAPKGKAPVQATLGQVEEPAY